LRNALIDQSEQKKLSNDVCSINKQFFRTLLTQIQNIFDKNILSAPKINKNHNKSNSIPEAKAFYTNHKQLFDNWLTNCWLRVEKATVVDNLMIFKSYLLISDEAKGKL